MTEKPESQTAKLAGVIGCPVTHSLSPLIHAIWAHRAGVNGHYIPIEVPAAYDDFARAMDSLQVIGFSGVNVTLPHKEHALRYASAASDRAKKAGAANMLTFRKGGADADNSDVEGFAASVLMKIGDAPPPERAVVLGAGGAARGVILALQAVGVKSVAIANRTRAKAEKIAAELGVETVSWEARSESLHDTDILVNTTSLGMTAQPALEIDLSDLPDAAVVADIVYTPLETDLLKRARTKGCVVIDGLAMLMHQAVPGFHAWFGADAAADDALRGELVRELERRKPRMIKIGLTGSIGMGKSTVLKMFGALGAAIWDADAAVHRLYEKDGAAVAPIAETFPGAVNDGAVDRAALAGIVLNDSAAIERLEAIVHPLVWRDREEFMDSAARAGAPVAVLDIPLLFENGMDAFFDAVVVVSAPAAVQRERVLARPGMTAAKLDAILARQTPDEEKRRRADYVVDTGQAIEKTEKDVAEIYDAILKSAS